MDIPRILSNPRDTDSTSTRNDQVKVQLSEESTDLQATDQKQFSYEQLLLIISCLYVSTGHHYRTGDERPLNDILQRRPETWTQTLDDKSWDSFCHAYNSMSPQQPKSFRLKELKEWTNNILDNLQYLCNMPPDQTIPLIASQEFPWDRSILLVCLYYGILSAAPVMSKFWDEERFARLTDKLSGSVLFPNSLTLKELESAVNSLALLLIGEPVVELTEGDPELPKPSQLMIPKDQRKSLKRSSQDNLVSWNTKALKK